HTPGQAGPGEGRRRLDEGRPSAGRDRVPGPGPGGGPGGGGLPSAVGGRRRPGGGPAADRRRACGALGSLSAPAPSEFAHVTAPGEGLCSGSPRTYHNVPYRRLAGQGGVLGGGVVFRRLSLSFMNGGSAGGP